MEIQEADLIHVWRTNGGLYVNENGRTGKPCALRRSPYGSNVSGPNLSAHYEVVYTRYGKRHRFIHPSEVRPGTSLRIETLRNGWVQTSLIQEVMTGVHVAELTPGQDYLVFDRHRASVVPDGDTRQSIPYLDQGWDGAPEPLWEPNDTDERVIVRLIRHDADLTRSERLLSDVPGWGFVVWPLEQLISQNPRLDIAGTWCASDGGLLVRLSGLPAEPDRLKALCRAVSEAETQSRVTCVRCASPGIVRGVAGPHGEPFGMPLCDQCAIARQQDDEERFPLPDWVSLPQGTVREDIQVEPGWWTMLEHLRASASKTAPIARMQAQQRAGRLQVRLDPAEPVNADELTQIQLLAVTTEQLSEEICEHCGRQGKLTTAPWTHVCCGICEAGALK